MWKTDMWILYACGSALFAGVTSILAKCGIRKTDSNVATAVRTIVVLAFSWLMVLVVGSGAGIGQIQGRTFLFLILSGLATGASWLCYFRALQIGDINKVVPIDKSSTVLTIVLAFVFLHETISLVKAAGVVLIAAGTFLMIERKTQRASSMEEKHSREEKHSMEEKHSAGKKAAGQGGIKAKSWLLYAVSSAVFASLTSILGKIGITGVESNLGTAIRTCVVLIMAWGMVFATGKQKTVKEIPPGELGFICLSGLATGGSWLCYYKALQEGPASVVVPIDKLSILVTVAFSRLVFGERLSVKSGLGLGLIVAGTMLMLF